MKYDLIRCEIDAGSDSVIVKLINGSGSGSPLMFEMLPGFHTQNFVAELFRLQEEVKVKLKEGVTYDFRWIENKIDGNYDKRRSFSFNNDVSVEIIFSDLFIQKPYCL